MRTEPPLAALRGRLGLRTDSGDTGDAGDAGDAPPAWVPDGRRGGVRAWRDALRAVRADPGRAGGIALGLIAALAVLVTMFTVGRSGRPPVQSANLPPVQMAATVSAPPPAPPQAAGGPVVVSIVGLVAQPGLVTLAPGARVADAVSAAGGPLRGADTLGLNLARRVADGEQIVVGIATPAGRPAVLGSSAGPAAGPVTPDSRPAPGGPVDLNTATVEQLDALPGVGPVTAAAIVAWRQANGRFASIDQLGEVDGIGPARLEKLRPFVTV